jgi:hypothetical protein
MLHLGSKKHCARITAGNTSVSAWILGALFALVLPTTAIANPLPPHSPPAGVSDVGAEQRLRAVTPLTCSPDSAYLAGPQEVADGQETTIALRPLVGGVDGERATAVALTPDADSTEPKPAGQHRWRINVMTGTVAVDVTYTDDDGCAQAKRLTIRAVAAKRPEPFLDIYKDPIDPSMVEIGIRSGDTEAECAVATTDPITLTIEGGGAREVARLGGPCQRWITSRNRRRHRLWAIRYQNLTEEHASLAELALRGQMDGRRVRFKYKLAWHGQILRRGSIVGVTRYEAAHEVWEGTDAFVNLCINNTKQIYSDGGRLYCWYSGFLRRSWRIL